MFRTLFAWVQKYERHLSAAAMIAGFVSDNLLFTRIDIPRTQIVFEVYAIACFISIPLYHFIQSRRDKKGAKPHRFWEILPLVTQFALGGFWSGFLIFYARSASLPASWPFLLLLVVVLIGNEYFKKYHTRLVFTSILFFLALYLYAVFALPIYTGTISTRVFFESGALAAIVFALFVALLWLLGRKRFSADARFIGLGALAVFLCITVSYLTNIIPPLPLSAKAAGVYHTVWRVPGAYQALTESESWGVAHLGLPKVVHVVQGDSLSVYSAVFAPVQLTTTIEHRWQWYSPQARKWITKAVVSYPIVGGNDGGYRGYSSVYMSESGRWRVTIETSDGRIISRLRFTVVYVPVAPSESTTTLL